MISTSLRERIIDLNEQVYSLKETIKEKNKRIDDLEEELDLICKGVQQIPFGYI